MPYIFVVMIIYQQENHKNQNKYLFCFRDKKTGYEGLGVRGLGGWGGGSKRERNSVNQFLDDQAI